MPQASCNVVGIIYDLKTARQLKVMNIQESCNIIVSDIEIKVEQVEESSVKPSAQIIPKESPIKDNFSLTACSVVKQETVVLKTEEDSTFHEPTESKLSWKEDIDEHFDDLKSIIPEEVYIKNELRDEDLFNTNKATEREIKDECFDGPEFIAHKDIVIKTEDQEEDQSDSKYFDLNCEESRKTFMCRYCYAGLSTENYKNSHERRCKFRNKEQHLAGSVFECSYCKLLYTREEDKKEHQSVCKRRKVSEKFLEKNRKKGERKYCCDKCNYKTQRKNSLVRHIQIHDKVNAPKYSCNQCPYQTINKSDLNMHLRSHNCFGLICILCQKSFKRKNCLDAHYVSRHPDKSDKWGNTITNKINECPKCSYKTVFTSSFKDHLAIHGTPTDHTQYKCNICKYKCIRKGDLTRHLRLHVGQLPFVCTKCDKRFNTKHHLDSHIISRHSDNEELTSSVTSKVHQCQKCNFKTIFSKTIKNHLKTCL